MLEIIAPKKYAALISEPALQAAYAAALQAAGNTESPSATLKLTDDKSIRKLNKAYLDQDQATDVLSFENEYTDPQTGQHFIGDIAISVETAQAQALAHQAELQQELEMLLVHGTLHLLGHDHADTDGLNAMRQAQDAALRIISNPLLGSIADLQA